MIRRLPGIEDDSVPGFFIGEKDMYLMIDNYDSFVYNLVLYFRELGEEVEVIRNDAEIELRIEELMSLNMLEGIIISPGPKNPKDCGMSAEIVKKYSGRVPILGVCLGHQVIGHVFGATVQKGTRPMHGKISVIETNGDGLFLGLPNRFDVTRYHSLVISEKDLPSELIVDATSEDGVIMGIHHSENPVYGVQFHPEAVLTDFGHELLANFCRICRDFIGGKVYEMQSI